MHGASPSGPPRDPDEPDARNARDAPGDPGRDDGPDRAPRAPRRGPLPRLALLPLMGPWHLRYPRYNAETVRALLAELDPDALLTSALEPGAFGDPGWRDTPEVALPHSAAPWAEARGTALHPVGEPSPDPAASADFARYAQQYPALRSALQEVDATLRELPELLGRPLTLERIESEVMPLLREHQEAREAAFGDGPASDWLRRRSDVVAERALGAARDAGGRAALLAPVDQIPFLRDALAGRAEAFVPPSPPPHAAERERALYDYAMRVEVPEPGKLLAQLREHVGPEARYHEANLLLANGHPAEALELLENASREDFSRPYWLPGFLLARLGQLYDLAGRRDAALRSYRGVRAFAWAPAEALEVAAAGLTAPFGFGDDTGGDADRGDESEPGSGGGGAPRR